MKTILAVALLFASVGSWAQSLSCTGQGFDTYCGILSFSCAGGASGYFYEEQKTDINGHKHWYLCTPLGHAYLQRSVYNYSQLPANFSAKYGSNSTTLTTHWNNRVLQVGMNGLDIFYSAYALPIATRDGGSANSVQLPFIVYFSPQNDAVAHPSWFGWSDGAFKNLCDGQYTINNGGSANHGFTGLQPYCQKGGSVTQYDYLDPRWQTANDDEMQFNFTGPGGGGGNPYFFGSTPKTSPWVLGYLACSDCGDYAAFTRGQGNYYYWIQYPLVGQIVATSAYDYTATPVSETWDTGNHLLAGKMAWACSGTNPSSCGGASYLESKYGTIASLKASWGSCASSYTTFGSTHPAGGFGHGGTGLLDEDGSGACFGSSAGDYYTQSNIPPAVIADLVNFSKIFVTATYAASVHSVKVTYGDTNHLIYCGNVGGTDDAGIRTETAQGMRDAGCNVIEMGWNSTYLTPVGQAANKAAYDATCSGGTCVPQTVWYTNTADVDSGIGVACTGFCQNDWATQVIRGMHYASDAVSLLTSQGSNGDYYDVGINFWSMMDNKPENTNFGLVSQTCSNLYDGVQATIGGIGGTGSSGDCTSGAGGGGAEDPYGFHTGGESSSNSGGNYGDYTDAVVTANASAITQFLAFFASGPSQYGTLSTGHTKASGKVAN